MRKTIFLNILLALLVSASASAQDSMRIAVMDLKADGVADRTARTVSNMLRTELVNAGKFTVVERNQMDSIFKEQGLQKTGCTDQECAVQLGRLMSAKKILVGEVSPMGKSIIMTVRIVDVERGVSEFAATEKALTEETLDQAVERIAEKLTGRIQTDMGSKPRKAEKPKVTKKRETEEAPKGITPAGYYLRAIVPGWGQFYTGHTIKGFIYPGVFALSCVFEVLMILNYNKKKKDYDDASYGTTQTEFDNLYNKYKKAALWPKIGIGLIAAAYAANWLDILIFSRPDFSAQASNTPKAGDIFVSINTELVPVGFTLEPVTKVGVGIRF